MRTMKDSGIEWIGEIPEGWCMRRLKTILSERKEKNDPQKTDFILSLGAAYGVVPYAEKEGGGNKAKEDLTDYRLAYPDDIVMNSMNIISGSVGISSYFGCVSPVYYILYPYDGCSEPKYYCYLFQSKSFQRSLMGLGNGILVRESSNGNFNTVRMRIPMEKLGVQLLPMPSFEEQRLISAYLDRQCALIDSVTEKTKASIEEYKKLRQAVITQAVTKGVRGDRPMKDSGIEWIGEIPENWTMLKMKKCLISAESGLSAVTNDASSDTGKFILRTSSVSSGVFKENEVKPVTEYALDRLICPVEANTVIMSRMNTAKMVGKCAYIERAYPDYYIPDKLWKLKFNNKLHAKYAWYLIDSEPIQGWFSCLATGSSDSMQNIALPDFYNTIAPIPTKEEQQEITAYLDKKCSEIDALITKKETFLAELEAYKKSIIYEYVTGKKEV